MKKYYFNFFDSRHTGYTLQQITRIIYMKFLKGDQDYAEMNCVVLELDTKCKYYLNIADDYCCWLDDMNYNLTTEQSLEDNYSTFFLEYIDKQWITRLSI